MSARLSCDPDFKRLIRMKAFIMGFPTVKAYTTWLYAEAERTKKNLGDILNEQRKT